MSEMQINANVLKLVQNSRSGIVEHVEMDVSIEGIQVHLSIDLAQAAVGDTTELLAFELGRLGGALNQIAQQPSLLSLGDR